MVPNCGVFTKRSGVPRLTWFKASKNSARNWNFIGSKSLNSRASAKSEVSRPGPMTVWRPRSPKVKPGGVQKAFGLNHSVAVCVPGPKSDWPVRFGRIGQGQLADRGWLNDFSDARIDGVEQVG